MLTHIVKKNEDDIKERFQYILIILEGGGGKLSHRPNVWLLLLIGWIEWWCHTYPKYSIPIGREPKYYSPEKQGVLGGSGCLVLLTDHGDVLDLEPEHSIGGALLVVYSRLTYLGFLPTKYIKKRYHISNKSEIKIKIPSQKKYQISKYDHESF